MIKDDSGKVVYLNRPTGAPFGIEGVGEVLRDELDARTLALDTCVEATETATSPAGDLRHFLTLRFPFTNRRGQRFIGAVALDITARRQAEDALRLSQFSIDRSPDSIIWINAQGIILYGNEAACLGTGYEQASLRGMHFSEIAPLIGGEFPDAGFGRLDGSGTVTTETPWRRRDGSEFPVELALYPLEFDSHAFTCCIGRDITDRRRIQAELSALALHDELTGLPNRRAFETILDRAIQSVPEVSPQGGEPVGALAVCFVDLDGFKLINDTLGHSLGDAFLQQVAGRLRSHLAEGETLARMGGDEFALIVPGPICGQQATARGERLLECLSQTVHIEGHELVVTSSTGISLFPFDGVDGSMLLRNADAAMYEAKRQGKNRIRLFHQDMNAAVRERLALENHLRRALERRELSVEYQPEISLRTNEILRYEALLRWDHPSLGRIEPAKFIPVAEETGLIVEIGEWVLDQACSQARRWMELGLKTGIAVNVSNLQFHRPDFEDMVAKVLDRTGLPARRLDIELTETVAVQGIEEAVARIGRLRAKGLTVSIDDFGTGYSSLNYLLRLQADHIKIDRSFVSKVPADPAAVSMTRGLVSLAHRLGMNVAIEGVETEEQLDAIRTMGCDVAQGFLLGRPQTGESIGALFAGHDAGIPEKPEAPDHLLAQIA
jgi:diguanylate cyclase (GGDEF)-like protein/PAS domain S-box-containing protein